MRRLIASTFVSLDGFIVGPDEDMSWVMNHFNEEMGDYAGDLMSSMDTILLGRVTYEGMSRVWPFQTEATAPGADKMNSTPKIVFSRSLDRVEWGSFDTIRVVRENVSEVVAGLKEQPGKDLVIYGSANLVQGLTRLGLIDEYQLLVHPVVLGRGKPLFAGMVDGDSHGIELNLLRAQTFANGVVVLNYGRADA
jgi:dihydrofolate reductase